MARAEEVFVTEDALTAELEDGRTISVPIVWYPRLSYATQKERENWRMIGKGSGIHWPDLDEDISIENMLVGSPSGESQKSLQRWLEWRDVQENENRSMYANGLFLDSDMQAVIARLKDEEARMYDYDYLQQSLQMTNVAEEFVYQSKFKSFYRIRRDDAWCSIFFSILEREKCNENVEFSEILQEIYHEARHGGRRQIEGAFASRLVATINPQLPVWDKHVLYNLGLKAPYPSMPANHKMETVIEIYSVIQMLTSRIVESEDFGEWSILFGRELPQFTHFTDVKKLDLFLWQNR